MEWHIKGDCLEIFLYIPFWLYSNEVRYLSGDLQQSFTFHSGYILMGVDGIHLKSNMLYIPFWLYSNFAAAYKLKPK